jgi:hypothetical protein
MLYSKCEDSHGRPVVDSALTINHYDSSRLVPVSGRRQSSPSNFGEAVSFIPSGYTAGFPQHLDLGIPYVGTAMTDLIARTNPSRPDILPLTLIQDLVEIPKMLKGVGKLLKTPRRYLNAKEGANQYLSAKFGWLPLVKDIHDVLDAQKYILRRKAELDRLYNTSSGLKRRLKLGSWHGEQTQGFISVNSDLLLDIGVKRSRYTSVERWGTIRWKPDVTPGYHPTDEELNQLARRVALGMTTEGTMAGLWDVIPWTWMINWFTNVRTFALQYSNSVPSTHQNGNVMTRTYTTEINIVTSITPGYSGGGGTRISERKERYTGSGTLSAHLPFLSADRLATLGALFVQRFKR